jgi:probable phosphoglycerate mutase
MNIIGLLRHGPTAWNRSKRIQGIRNIPLDLETFDPEPWQALLTAYGPWNRIVTSPLDRCYDTARLLFPGRPLATEAGLREQDWGVWTGLSVNELRTTQPGIIEAQERLGWDFTPQQGESRREVLARVLAAIIEATRGYDGQRILLVTHQGVIKVLLNHLQDRPFLPEHSAPLAKRALHVLEQNNSTLRILHSNILLP